MSELIIADHPIITTMFTRLTKATISRLVNRRRIWRAAARVINNITYPKPPGAYSPSTYVQRTTIHAVKLAHHGYPVIKSIYCLYVLYGSKSNDDDKQQSIKTPSVMKSNILQHHWISGLTCSMHEGSNRLSTSTSYVPTLSLLDKQGTSHFSTDLVHCHYYDQFRSH